MSAKRCSDHFMCCNGRLVSADSLCPRCGVPGQHYRGHVPISIAHHVRLTLKVEMQIVQRRAAGETQMAIGNHYGISTGRVRYVERKYRKGETL